MFFAVGSDKDRRTPLESAVQAADLREVQRLLASGADPNDRGIVYGSPLNAAASRQHNVNVIEALIAAGANPNGRGEEGNTCWASPVLICSGDRGSRQDSYPSRFWRRDPAIALLTSDRGLVEAAGD